MCVFETRGKSDEWDITRGRNVIVPYFCGACIWDFCGAWSSFVAHLDLWRMYFWCAIEMMISMAQGHMRHRNHILVARFLWCTHKCATKRQNGCATDEQSPS